MTDRPRSIQKRDHVYDLASQERPELQELSNEGKNTLEQFFFDETEISYIDFIFNEAGVDSLLEMIRTNQPNFLFVSDDDTSSKEWNNFIRVNLNAEKKQLNDGSVYILTPTHFALIQLFLENKNYIVEACLPSLYPKEKLVSIYPSSQGREPLTLSINDVAHIVDSIQLYIGMNIMQTSAWMDSRKKEKRVFLYSLKNGNSPEPIHYEGHTSFIGKRWTTSFNNEFVCVGIPRENDGEESEDLNQIKFFVFLDNQGEALSVEGVDTFADIRENFASNVGSVVLSPNDVLPKGSITFSNMPHLGSGAIINFSERKFIRLPQEFEGKQIVVSREPLPVRLSEGNSSLGKEGFSLVLSDGTETFSVIYSAQKSAYVHFDESVGIRDIRPFSDMGENAGFISAQAEKNGEYGVYRYNSKENIFESTQWEGSRQLSFSNHPLLAVKEKGQWSIVNSLKKPETKKIQTHEGAFEYFDDIVKLPKLSSNPYNTVLGLKIRDKWMVVANLEDVLNIDGKEFFDDIMIDASQEDRTFQVKDGETLHTFSWQYDFIRV